LHYDSVNISTYRTDELAKLHAVLLEQYPKHYLTLLENYNQILSNAMDGPFPITLDQERSVYGSTYLLEVISDPIKSGYYHDLANYFPIFLFR